MRVVAFWAAIAGLVAIAGQATVLAAQLTGWDANGLLAAAELAAAIGQIAFTALVAVFLLIVAVTDRKS